MWLSFGSAGPAPAAPLLRARRTAAFTRMAVGIAGIALVLGIPSLTSAPLPTIAGFAVIALTALLQHVAPGVSWLTAEESLSASAAVLIIGLGDERVSVLSILWLTAIASGVLARGGRHHWLGRSIVLIALLAPIAHHASLSAEYAAFCIATLALLLTSGRLTQELNQLLLQARAQADSASTLLLAGDIAARMDEREGRSRERHTQQPAPVVRGLSQEQIAGATMAIEQAIEGVGLSIAAQPIVDISSWSIHAYEGLARFSHPDIEGGPLHWLALAERLGLRPELERACLRAGLEMLAVRPPGTRLSLNVSAPVLVEQATQQLLQSIAKDSPDGLQGLIVEITEETLVHSDVELLRAFQSLRSRGASLAVDDMGAGYSGLRQITAVRPRYLKLDRSLVTGIDGDAERTALLSALASYARQVECLLVVEGVETDAELRTVNRAGAQLVQGFRVGRPARPWPMLAQEIRAAAASATESEVATMPIGAPGCESPAQRHGPISASASALST